MEINTPPSNVIPLTCSRHQRRSEPPHWNLRRVLSIGDRGRRKKQKIKVEKETISLESLDSRGRMEERPSPNDELEEVELVLDGTDRCLGKCS